MTKRSLAERAAAVSWWHGGMDLGDGVITQGGSMPAVNLLPTLMLPADLTGLSVLDVGTWDGYMAFECEKRGASRVVAVDSYVWRYAPTGRAGFDLAHEALGSKVQAAECEVLDLLPGNLGTFDIVLFLGVLYHMRHPLLALERVAAMTHDLLIAETHIITHSDRTPHMRFYPGNELNNDDSNWWGPNVACVEAMLRDVGFKTVECVSNDGARAVFHARKTG